MGELSGHKQSKKNKGLEAEGSVRFFVDESGDKLNPDSKILTIKI